MIVMDSRRLFQSFFATVLIMLVATIAAATAADAKMETKLAVCPVSLTNPDGQELALEKYDLRLAVHGPLALTEMEMVFRNPQNRQMEGRFQYLLPTSATVSRFAKEVAGNLMEGEVVETQKARSVYREILHSMRDPALLEQDQGNRFAAKVFPIPANGTVRLVLSYSQVLPIKNNQRRIVVPLAGMPKIADFTFTGVVQYFSGESLGEDTAKYLSAQPMDGQFVRLSKHATDFVPDRDIELTFVPAVDAPKINVIKAGNYEMVSYRADFAPSEGVNVKRDWAFYIDTSASGADMEARRTLALTKILQGLDEASPGQRASAYVFDVDVASLFSNYQLTAQRERAIDFAHLLQNRHCLGATDLARTLKHIGETARSTREPARFVLVSDGIASWGKRELTEVLAELGEWPAKHVLHALVLGSKQDEKLLNALVAKTNGRVVSLGLGDTLDASIGKALSDLTEPTGQSFEFYDEGAAWIFPKTFRDVRPGTEMIAFCELKEGAKAKPGVVYPKGLGKVDVPIDAIPAEAPAFAPLLMREAIAAKLAHMEKLELEEKDAKKTAESRQQRIALSVKSRVLCPPLTSLLVLETEEDYARFRIERTSLADVLVVGAKGIEQKARKAQDLVLREVRKNPEVAKAKSLAKKSEEKVASSAAEAVDGKWVETVKELKDQAEELEEAGEYLEKLDSVDQDADGERRAVRRGGGRAQATQGFVGGDDARADRPNAHPFAQPNNPAPTVSQQAGAVMAVREPNANQAEEAPRSPEAQTRAPAAAAPNLPGWTKYVAHTTEEASLNALRAKVEAAPRDRNLRNSYANALALSQKWDTLQAVCFEWMPFDPENPQVYEYLGKSAAGLGDAATALRAVSSIAEIAPNNAALLGRAGWVLLCAKNFPMSEALFREALKQRQDDPNLYRGLALCLWQAGKLEDALTVYEGALKVDFNNRYGDAKRVLKEEAAYVVRGMPWKEGLAPDQDPREIWPKKLGLNLKHADALRVTLGWETDANDVDLHVIDPSGEECFYSHAKNASGLELYSDQTQGLGPEVIRCEKAQTGTYHVGVNYFSAGPMGVSRGVVVVFQPQDGIVKTPLIVPFCLVPEEGEGKDMRHLCEIKF